MIGKKECFVCGKSGRLNLDRVDKYLPDDFVNKANKYKLGIWADVLVCKDHTKPSPIIQKIKKKIGL